MSLLNHVCKSPIFGEVLVLCGDSSRQKVGVVFRESEIDFG